MVDVKHSLKERITEDMKSAMRARDEARRDALRLILAAIKQQEVDTRKAVDDTQMLVLLNRMLKQRNESITQYRKAGREDLLAREQFEVDVIKSYLPPELSDSEVETLIIKAIDATGASSLRDMGKVMAQIKPQLLGRADMAAVGEKVKGRLATL
jgi:hypothetical protein